MPDVSVKPNQASGSAAVAPKSAGEASLSHRFLRPLRRNINVVAILAIVVVLMVGFSLASPYFLTGTNLANMLRQCASSMIAGVGMTLVLSIAGIDLSVGSVLTLASAMFVVLLAHGMDGTLAVTIVLFSGIAVGIINGYFVAYQRLPAFIVTLAGLVGLQGVADLIAQGQSFPANSPAWLISLGQGSVGPLPAQLFLEIVVIAAGWYTLNRLRIGKHMLGIGSNEEAVRRSGVNTRLVIMIVYVVAALTAAFGGLMETARIGTGSAELIDNFELLVIAGVVLGGTSLFGGRASVIGTALGVWALEVIENGLVLVHVDAYWVPIFEGAIVLGAVLFNSRVLSKLKLGRLPNR